MTKCHHADFIYLVGLVVFLKGIDTEKICVLDELSKNEFNFRSNQMADRPQLHFEL